MKDKLCCGYCESDNIIRDEYDVGYYCCNCHQNDVPLVSVSEGEETPWLEIIMVVSLLAVVAISLVGFLRGTIL